MTPARPFPVPSVDPDELDRATERFVDRAAREQLLDVVYDVIDSPVGPLAIAATPKGLVQVAFLTGGLESVLQHLSARVSPRVLLAPERLAAFRIQLDEYFSRKRTRFEMPLDLRLIRGFQTGVLRATSRIPYGKVATYRAISTRAGNERAVRAAGSALGANPLPIVIPCHRVLRSDGTLGGYGGGLDRKRQLLELEGAALG